MKPELAEKVKIACRSGARLAWNKQDAWQQNAHGYTCTLSYRGRKMTLDFWMGTGIGEPTASDILDCLLSDAGSIELSFEDWCQELGADPDSRKAKKIYRACAKQTERLKTLLGDDYETFLNADLD